ncbi:unnamed protein product [Linum trigynum]|uniref:Uncharacterized protein n=1 Tax=Linum trigynum TaxID=586398 RepID=A0AAV2F3E5_9ROSI
MLLQFGVDLSTYPIDYDGQQQARDCREREQRRENFAKVVSHRQQQHIINEEKEGRKGEQSRAAAVKSPSYSTIQRLTCPTVGFLSRCGI